MARVLIISLLIISAFAFAEEHTIEIPGVQVHPSVYGRYIAYMQDIGNGKYDIHVYDSGPTLDPRDDAEEIIIITADGRDHNYAEPVIDGRYIAWLDRRIENQMIVGTDVYVFDMGEEMMIGPGEGYRKLNTFDGIKGRHYIQKQDLDISDGTLVWEDYDDKNGDSDIRGYDLNVPGDAINAEDDSHHLIISDEKTQTLNGLTERIEEVDPFISGKEVAYASTYLHPFEEFAEVYQEIYKKDLSTGASKLVSNPESEYSFASMPSFDSGSVLWVDYIAPRIAILEDNIEIFSVTDGQVIHPNRFNDMVTFMLEKDGELSLNLLQFNNAIKVSYPVENTNEHSSHYSGYDKILTFSSGENLILAFIGTKFIFAGTHDFTSAVQLERGKALYTLQDEGIKAAVSDHSASGTLSLVANGDKSHIIPVLPFADGKGGGIIPWINIEEQNHYARFVNRDGTLYPPVLIGSSNHGLRSFYPDNAGGAFSIRDYVDPLSPDPESFISFFQ